MAGHFPMIRVWCRQHPEAVRILKCFECKGVLEWCQGRHLLDTIWQTILTAVWAKFCRVATRRSNTLNIRCWPQFLSPFPLLWCDLGYTSKAGCTFLFPWWVHGRSAQRLGHSIPSFPVSFFPFPFSLLPFCLSGLGSVCFIPPFPPRFPFPLFCLLVGYCPACSLPLLCFPLFSCCCLSLAVHVPSFLSCPRLCVCVC